MPPASSRGLRSDAPSSSRLSRSQRRIQELASFPVRARQPRRGALPPSRHTHSQATREMSPATIGGLLQSSVFTISLHPVFAHVVLAHDLAGLLRKAPVSARLRLVAALRRLRPMRMRALFGRMLPSGQSDRPLFMRRSRPGRRWQDRDRGPPAPADTPAVVSLEKNGWPSPADAGIDNAEKDGSHRKPCSIGRQQIRRCPGIADWRIGEQVDNGYARRHLVQHRLHLTCIRAVQPKIREQRNHGISLPKCVCPLRSKSLY
jgi:hypothetical protein